MFSIQQLIKSTRKLQASSVSSVSSTDLAKNLKHAAVAGNNSNTNTNHQQQTHLESGSVLTMTSALPAPDMTSTTLSPSSSTSSSTSSSSTSSSSSSSTSSSPQQQQTNLTSQQTSREEQNSNELKICQRSKNTTNSSGSCSELSLCSHLNESGSPKHTSKTSNANTQEQKLTTNISNTNTITAAKTSRITSQHFCKRSQQIQNFYQQQLHQFHIQANQSLWAKQKQTHFTMSSLAATEPLSTLKSTDDISTDAAAAAAATTSNTNGDNGVAENSNTSMTNKGKTCFKSGYPEILQFMELIGNLKHTKRTGWVLRDVNDCESISGHMYRMSMMTFLLDGTEGLNQIRCMELALVHDLAESIVGDLTPFCGISKEEKRAMEFKAMDDICKLIEPRGKRIMELFVEYETGESAESKFVKDLDRLDMVMQAFEYEKRDNCLLKHQEFFDSTEGKFKHPFVQQLVKEIYAQRTTLANAQGATPPPNIVVPDWEHAAPNQSNGHCSKEQAATATELQAEQSSSSTSTS